MNILLKDNPKNYKTSRKDYKQLSGQQCQNSQQDKKFDKLLNKKCSWSYKSQKSINRNKMDTDSPQVQSDFITGMLYNKSEELVNDESPGESNENGLNTPDKTHQEENQTIGLSRNAQIESIEFEEGTEDFSERPGLENIEEMSPKFSSTPYPKKALGNKIAKNITEKCNESLLSSSSDEEIFQTRLSVDNNNLVSNKEKCSNNSSPVLLEKILDKENTPENYSEIRNMPPIIIQAIACDKSNFTTQSVDARLDSKIKYPEKNKMDIVLGDSLNVEKSNFKVEMENCYIKHFAENNEFDYETRKNTHKTGNEELLKERKDKMSAISVNDSAGLELESLDDITVQNFLNGSLDLCRSDRWPSKYVIEKSVLYCSPGISSKSLKRKQLSKEPVRSTKKAQTAKKRKIKTPHMPVESPTATNLTLNSKIENKFLNATTHRKKIKKPLFNNDDITISKNIDIENGAIDSKNKVGNTRTKKKNKEGSTSNTLFYNNSSVRHSERNKRNSSLIASRKIKEIEKLENYDNYEEICLASEGEAYVSDNVKNKANKYNFGTKETNNYKYQIENILNNVNKFKDNNMIFEEVDSNENSPFYSTTKGSENTWFARYNRKLENELQIAVDHHNINDKSTLKKNNTKKIENKYFSLDKNLSNNYFMQNNEDLCKNLYHNRKKGNKTADTVHSESTKTETLHRKNTANKNVARKDNLQSIVTYKGPMTRGRRKTWDMLEKELLGELDNETSLKNNVCETVMVKKAKIVRKQNVTDSDLYTLSNTSTMQIRKSTERNKYNMQCEINTERKYSESTINSTCNYSNASKNVQSKEIVPHNSKNVNILERAITAMEKCTSKFIAPQVYTYEHTANAFEIEDMSENSDTSHEALFHSNILFMRNENERYYKNEIIGYLKKSSRKGSSNQTECENFDDAEHLEGNNSVRVSNFSKSTEKYDYTEFESVNEASKALIPLNEGNNPWNKLMRKLNLDQDKTDECSKKISHVESTKQLSNKSMNHTNDSSTILSNYLKREPKMISATNFKDEEINNQDEGNYTENQSRISKMMENEDLLTADTFQSNNFHTLNNFTLTTDAESKRRTDKKKKTELDNESIAEKLEKRVKKLKKNESKITTMQMVKKTPKFKLQIVKDGSVKLKRHSSKSSLSSSSFEYIKTKYNGIKDLKRNNPTIRKNTGGEKYRKYLSNVFDKENSTLDKYVVEDHDKTKSLETKSKDKENSVKNKSIGSRIKMKLIAESDDDVFSLSSSDSEAGNEKNPGSGLLCELFDD